MNDKELLELAAKAAGADITGFCGKEPLYGIEFEVGENDYEYKRWNPLTDDGDALRLAVKLKMRMSTICNAGDQCVASKTDFYTGGIIEDYGKDPCAAMRRAIVKVAAKVGETL